MKIIAANFKANLTRKVVQDYAYKLDSYLTQLANVCLDSKDCFEYHMPNDAKHLSVRLFPSHTALLDDGFKYFHIGAQNAYHALNGGFTGEIGLSQLQEFHIQSILIGHSERRTLFFENQYFINKKFAFYAQADFEIVYCIGEDLAVRQQGKEALTDFLSTQLAGIDTTYNRLIIAYEPIWAIGTGVSASIEQIKETHEILANFTDAPLLYGGSVNAENAQEILNVPHVSGVLVGSASLTFERFKGILDIACGNV